MSFIEAIRINSSFFKKNIIKFKFFALFFFFYTCKILKDLKLDLDAFDILFVLNFLKFQILLTITVKINANIDYLSKTANLKTFIPK